MTTPASLEAEPTNVRVGAAASHAFSLPIPADTRQHLVRGWLYLGVGSLVASGFFSLLLVLARTPGIQDRLPWADFFHTALVVHVDLSVLVWFLSFAGVFWSINATNRWRRLGEGSLVLAAAGALVIALSAFVGDGRPLMSNYIPVLQAPVFLAGLVVFAAGITLLVVRNMVALPPVGYGTAGERALRFGLNAATVSTLLALIAFGWSFATMPAFAEGKSYYELLFWGGGHVLQFTYTLLMLVAWLWLASACGLRLPFGPRVVLVLFGLGLVMAFFMPLIYYAYPVGTTEHIKFFTWLMAYGGSLATVPVGLAMAMALITAPKPAPDARPLRAALIMSLVLFGLGGVIGFLIRESNVTIPAHYHGSIVGVTLAFMGLTYHLLPRLGFQLPERKLATLQPYVYGGGQLLHVVGLVWSGGYGVQRKVAGAAQALDTTERIAGMALMGTGGLIAIIGGVLFLVVVAKALLAKTR